MLRYSNLSARKELWLSKPLTKLCTICLSWLDWQWGIYKLHFLITKIIRAIFCRDDSLIHFNWNSVNMIFTKVSAPGAVRRVRPIWKRLYHWKLRYSKNSPETICVKNILKFKFPLNPSLLLQDCCTIRAWRSAETCSSPITPCTVRFTAMTPANNQSLDAIQFLLRVKLYHLQER